MDSPDQAIFETDNFIVYGFLDRESVFRKIRALLTKIQHLGPAIDNPHHTHPIVSEASGTMVFEDFIDGVTVTEQLDEVTGLSNVIIMDYKKQTSTSSANRPKATLLNSRGKPVMFKGTETPINNSPDRILCFRFIFILTPLILKIDQNVIY